MKFTQEQVRREIKALHEDDLLLEDSKVYQAWVELAEEWFATGGDGQYYLDGFVGFNDRTPENILLDFHLNDLLSDPLSEKQMEQGWV